MPNLGPVFLQETLISYRIRFWNQNIKANATISFFLLLR